MTYQVRVKKELIQINPSTQLKLSCILLTTKLTVNSSFRPPNTLHGYYGFGQLSVAFLRANVGYHSENSHDPARQSWPEQLLAREERLSSCNLDVRFASFSKLAQN